ncbi:MAG: LPS export ABC transporter periplasmic protein LptC [Candidatus Sulfotelmatobacter sp.]
MPLPIYRLRRWLVATAVIFTVVIAAMYLSARLRERNVLKDFPGKLGFDIKQTASGFQFSKSEAGRTVFTIRARDVKEFKLNGRAELHAVNIVLYGRDSSRFDQISGDDFAYDPKSGEVTAQGEVQIDLEANPGGTGNADQAEPKALRNPIHLRTSDLVFNRDSGDASTMARVDFRTPQASGWAVGMHYLGKTNTLTLDSQIHVTLAGDSAPTLVAAHGQFTRDPRQLVLDHPRLKQARGTLQSDQATFFLGPNNEVERVLATGNVNAEGQPSGAASTGHKAGHTARRTEVNEQTASALHARADQADLQLTGTHNQLRTAILTGNVQVDRLGAGGMQGNAARVVVDFAGGNVAGGNRVRTVHATEGVRLSQRSAGSANATTSSAGTSSGPQDFELTAPVVDFFVLEGRRLDHAVTFGAAQITISPTQNSIKPAQSPDQRTVITAGRFDAKFEPTADGQSRLSSMHGAPNAKIVSTNPGQPDRVSTSQTLDAAILPQGGIGSIVQQGSVVYSDGQTPGKRTQAWAERARYTPADQVLVLSGSPRVAEGSMATTARTIRLNRTTGDAFADGDVKSTYSEIKEQPNGALLASSSPIHVTAANMTVHNSTAVAFYQGNARLWQDANLIAAPSIDFDRDRRFLTAQGTPTQPVSTVLVQSRKTTVSEGERNTNDRTMNTTSVTKPVATSAVAITSALLTYSDADRHAHYDGGIQARGSDFTASAKSADAYLVPRAQTSINQALGGPSQLDHLLATGDVLIQQSKRRATGQKLIYTPADDKFVLTGGPPSIFDAERGTITGVSLTFYNRDDRVLVEGEASTPVVTQTRVAR